LHFLVLLSVIKVYEFQSQVASRYVLAADKEFFSLPHSQAAWDPRHFPSLAKNLMTVAGKTRTVLRPRLQAETSNVSQLEEEVWSAHAYRAVQN
jgi:hypothetical protein